MLPGDDEPRGVSSLKHPLQVCLDLVDSALAWFVPASVVRFLKLILSEH